LFLLPIYISICFSTIIFTITRSWHIRPGLAAVPIASQTRIKKKYRVRLPALPDFLRSTGFRTGSTQPRDSNFDPSVVQPVASRCTDYAIPAAHKHIHFAEIPYGKIKLICYLIPIFK
jgi:hypothetical protein